MHTVVSFHGSAVKPDQLSGIMADYLALERARTFRRLLVKRFGVLAAIFAGVSFLSAVRFRARGSASGSAWRCPSGRGLSNSVANGDWRAASPRCQDKLCRSSSQPRPVTSPLVRKS